jgi:hypothetical protein
MKSNRLAETGTQVAPTEAQQTVLADLPHHQVLYQFKTGELIVAPPDRCASACVIDGDGRLYPYLWYMASRGQSGSGLRHRLRGLFSVDSA